MALISLFSRLLIGFNLLFLNEVSAVEPVITSPISGSVVEGIVEIRGSVPESDFSTAKVSYSYAGDEANWFLIARIEQPVEEDVLAIWDTSTITDGIYQLRLTVKNTSGEKQEVIISDIRVANYTRVEHQQAAAEINTAMLTPTPDTTTAIAPLPTSLSANPASISDKEISKAVLNGGLFGLAVVIVFVIWTSIKTYLNRR